MDVLARASMKDAAKCDTHCELQISVNHQISERIWRCGDFPAARLFQCLLNHTSNTPPRFIRKSVTAGLTFVSINCCLHVFFDALRYFLGVDVCDGVVSLNFAKFYMFDAFFSGGVSEVKVFYLLY